MKPNTMVAARSRPNRMLVALAAAWMVLSVALGGVVNAETKSDSAATTSTSTTARTP